MVSFKVIIKNLKTFTLPPYSKMAHIQDGGQIQIGVRLSGNLKTVKAPSSLAQKKYIIIRSIR